MVNVKGRKKVRVGVIGLGVMGSNHVRVLNELVDARLLAVCDVREDLAKNTAERYHCSYYTDSDKFLSDSGVDAVVIATPTITHKELALLSLEYDKHLLVEKPMAATVDDAKIILSRASSKDVFFTVGFIERFNPAVIEAKRQIQSGGIGHPILLVAKRVSQWPVRIGDVGVVVDLAIHDIDIARYVFEKDPSEVYASIGSLRHSFEDYANILLRYDNGETAFIETNWLTPHKVRKLTVTGSEGLISLDYISQEIDIENNSMLVRPRLEYREPLKVELSHFISCIKNGTKPIVSVEDGLKAQQIAEMVLKSSELHKSMKL